MTPLETALVILVSIWSIIFIIIAAALIIILSKVQSALNKINKILDTAENVTEGVGGPLKTVASSIFEFLRKRKKKKLIN